MPATSRLASDRSASVPNYYPPLPGPPACTFDELRDVETEEQEGDETGTIHAGP